MSEREVEDSLTAEIENRAEEYAERLIQELKARSLKLALAESCTAGMISALLANTKGASSVLYGSFVCYTQEAKAVMLGLDNEALTAQGLVSRETALAMAKGALEKSGADIAAAVTGLAGPEGDGSNVPVGTVWTAASFKKEPALVQEYRFTGSRNAVRLQAAFAVLELINKLLTKK